MEDIKENKKTHLQCKTTKHLLYTAWSTKSYLYTHKYIATLSWYNIIITLLHANAATFI